MIASAIISLIALIGYLCCHEDEDKEGESFSLKFIKIFCPLLIIRTLGTVFVPTTKEALLIYGVGGTVDYIKANPTAKKLPDKCISALDKWVDSWTEKSDSTKTKE
jgi:hypothetical protein